MSQVGKVFGSPAVRDDKMQALMLIEEMRRRKRTRQIWSFFPDTGPLRRELYQRHLQFFRKGRTCRNRLVLAANRVGKTHTMGLYELVLHLIGRYPPWWEGRRFLDKKVVAWACTDKNSKIRDNLVRKLLGGVGEEGTGLIPADYLINFTNKSGISGSADQIFVQHSSGEISQLTLKSYEEGPKGFFGEEMDVIHLDEEPPYDIYQECRARQLQGKGMMMLTFTPLEGMGKVTLDFLHDGDIEKPFDDDSKCVIMASWEDVPHLDQNALDELMKDLEPHQRDARSKGIPAMGAGVVYPYRPDDIKFDPAVLWKDSNGRPPDNWKRVFALDPGWNVTGVLWAAIDPSTQKAYIYDEYYGVKGEPFFHAQIIKKRGDWIPGVIDPAAEGSLPDGNKLIELYKDEGIIAGKAINNVNSGISLVRRELTTGQLYISKNCMEFWREFSMYIRKEKNGKFVINKEKDHLMDAMRYLVVSGLPVAKAKPIATKKHSGYTGQQGQQSWMGT